MPWPWEEFECQRFTCTDGVDQEAPKFEAHTSGLEMASLYEGQGRRSMCCIAPQEERLAPTPPLAQKLALDAVAKLTPNQRSALNSLARVACCGYIPAVELRGERGSGITTILRALCRKLDLALLGTHTSLEAAGLEPAAIVYERVFALLDSGVEVVVVDDIDLAAAPSSLRSPDTEHLSPSSSEASRVPKALGDACEKRGACLVYSTVETSHRPFRADPVVVRIPGTTSADYDHLLRAFAGPDHGVDADALFVARPLLTPAQLRNLCCEETVIKSQTSLLAPPSSSSLSSSASASEPRDQE